VPAASDSRADLSKDKLIARFKQARLNATTYRPAACEDCIDADGGWCDECKPPEVGEISKANALEQLRALRVKAEENKASSKAAYDAAVTANGQLSRMTRRFLKKDLENE
jgi:hypothetical protein